MKRTPVAHPYARISDPEQRKGGGLERQTKADVGKFCEQFEFALGKRIYIDDGVSAFKGLNATPEHQLGQFLADARKGTIRPGDCLLLENYDRLSRQDPWAAIGLVNELRQLGIHVGRLDRMKLLRCDSTDYGDFFEAAVEFMRGNSESAIKSMRNKDRWKKKRAAARADGRPTVITRRLPAWVEERGGKLHLRPGPAAAVRHMFALAASGYGHLLIAKKLIAEGVPSFGRSGKWARSYVAKILSDRRTLGEFQPRLSDRSPEGDVIPDYFPPVVTEAQFYAAREGAAQRRWRRGAAGKHVNLFAGLLVSARDGESYFVTMAMRRDGTGYRVLKNTASLQGRAKACTFPLEAFEGALLGLLRELDPHAILNGDHPDESSVLAGELAAVEAELVEAAAFMKANKFSATIGKHVQALEDRQDALALKLAEARQRAAHPLSETWGESHTLIDVLAEAADPTDVRLRLRAALRRMVDSIQLLVVPLGRDRLAVAQILFAGGKRQRGLIVLHRPGKANGSASVPGGCWPASLPERLRGFDMSDREQAAALERLLRAEAAVIVEELTGGE
jgi:DNA invertase Pin-like site-specific DNA recombinase